MLFDKHYEQQNELVDEIAERIHLLGGVSIAMAPVAAQDGDDGTTNDRLVSGVIRTNELQAWFVAEHDVDTPAVRVDD